MRLFIMFITSILLGGCITASSGGSGEMASGQPIIGKWEHDPSKQENYVTLISPTGWSCFGAYEGGTVAGNEAITTVPLECTNGTSGKIVLSLGRKLVGAFVLSEGQTGRITFFDS